MPMTSSGSAAFERALAFVLSVEGGWWPGKAASDPNPTMRGITQKTYDRFRDLWRRPRQSVRRIEEAELRTIYHSYWVAAGCPHLDWPVAVLHFDTAVNSGPGNAKKLGVRAGYQVEAYFTVRLAFYEAIAAAAPEKAPNLPGWKKRLARLRTFIREHPTA